MNKIFLKRVVGCLLGVVALGGYVFADVSCSDCACYGGHYTSKSYFSDKIGWFQSGSYLHTVLFRINVVDRCPDGWQGALQVVPFIGKTTEHSSAELARWFGYNHKGVVCCPIVFGEATVGGEDQILDQGLDLDARHFNVRTKNKTFKSKVSFAPEESFFGVGINWKQSLWRNDDGTHRWWIGLSAPFVHLKHNMKIWEYAEDFGGGRYDEDLGIDEDAYVGTMSDAFMQPGWYYGKIAPCDVRCGPAAEDMIRNRFADAEIKVGYNNMLLDCAQLESFVGVVLPTGNKPEARYLFEAIVGNGGHAGITFGTELGFKLYDTPYGQLGWFIAMEGRYLFAAFQMRSFDLVGRPWSRYQSMFASESYARTALSEPAGKDSYLTHGINLMTRCVEVHPRGQLNLVSGWEWASDSWVAEVGYGFYARQAERITPNWVEGPILAGRVFDPAPVTFGPARTMRDPMRLENDYFNTARFGQYYDLLKIKKCDVDWTSASHPGVVSNTLYAAAGYQWLECAYPALLSCGAAWDYAFSNTAMHKVTLFAKLGCSF